MKPTCSVCMQPYVNQTFLQPCYHSFCFSCARQWINISPTCPLCKQDVRSLVYDICEETSSFQEYILAFGLHGKHNPPPKRRAPTLQEKARMFRARVYETEFATITYPAPLGRFASMTRIEPVHIAKVTTINVCNLYILVKVCLCRLKNFSKKNCLCWCTVTATRNWNSILSIYCNDPRISTTQKLFSSFPNGLHLDTTR